jgi:hypothetical protein
MVWFVPPAGRLRRAPGWTRVAASATSHHRSEQLQRWRRHRHDALGLKALRASADETAPMPWDASKSGVIPYQKPPKEIQALVDADLDPVLALSPGEEIRYILELKRPPRSPIPQFRSMKRVELHLREPFRTFFATSSIWRSSSCTPRLSWHFWTHVPAECTALVALASFDTRLLLQMANTCWWNELNGPIVRAYRDLRPSAQGSSPDGKYLLVERIERPYSTSVPRSTT